MNIKKILLRICLIAAVLTGACSVVNCQQPAPNRTLPGRTGRIVCTNIPFLCLFVSPFVCPCHLTMRTQRAANIQFRSAGSGGKGLRGSRAAAARAIGCCPHQSEPAIEPGTSWLHGSDPGLQSGAVLINRPRYTRQDMATASTGGVTQRRCRSRRRWHISSWAQQLSMRSKPRSWKHSVLTRSLA